MKNADNLFVTQRKPSCATIKLMLFAVSKLNGSQRKTLVNPRRMHCMYCGIPKGGCEFSLCYYIHYAVNNFSLLAFIREFTNGIVGEEFAHKN